MLKLNFNLRHQAITLSNPGTIVATDSKNYLVANFNFISDDWEYPLTAVFTSDVEKIPYTILVGQSEELEENECFIPWEVLQSSGNVYVSVFCGDLHTANTVKFKVVKSGYTEGEIPPPPTPTIYEQILQALDSKQPMLTAGQNITISEENVISASNGSNDYTDLTNKPSINNVTLSGNKTSDDLSLQSKLTAGNNITIDEDNVISAEGGTDDYRELDNIPIVIDNTGIDTFSLIKGINLDTSQFTINMNSNGFVRASLWRVSKYILEDYFRFYNGGDLIDSPYYRSVYNFNNLIIEVAGEAVNYRRTGFWFMQGVNCQNVPQAFSGLISNNTIMLVSHLTGNPIHNTTDMYIYRLVYIIDSQNKVKLFLQYCKSIANATGTVTDITSWQEIGGSNQIVSGVVNANGAITFTDSDGNTFTTTGSSVIGPQGDDYVLTAQDKSDIADIVLSELPTTQGVQYGNTSN